MKKSIPNDIERDSIDIKRNPVDCALNTNLKDMMMAFNNIMGFNLFNCPKTFLVFVSLAQGFSVLRTLHFFKKEKLALIKLLLAEAFIQPFMYRSGKVGWIATDLNKWVADPKSDKALNTYIHLLLQKSGNTCKRYLVEINYKQTWLKRGQL